MSRRRRWFRVRRVLQQRARNGMTERDEPNEHEGEHSDEPDKSEEHPHKARELLHRPAVRIAIAVVGVLLIVVGIVLWIHARRFETTDDAFVDARIVRLAPQISGRIAHVYATDNQLVHVGDVLVEIDPGDVSARLKQAQSERELAKTQVAQAQAQVHSSEAALRRAESMLAGARAQADKALRDLSRFRSLQAENPRAVAQTQVDQASAAAKTATAERDANERAAEGAKAALEAARAEAASATARITVLDAQVQQAQLSFGYARIVSPVDGHIAQRNAAVGTFVTPGQQMLAIVPLAMWVTANFKETQLANLHAGQHVHIDIDACPDADAQGHVDSIQRGAGQAFALLPAENATGNYVKVVQRVPVKIVFDRVRGDCPLGPGLSVVPSVRVQ
jgi:membrane fusion protein (multidrug efflux system)